MSIEINPVNINNMANEIQDMEDVEYIDVDKTNNNNLIST
jgi:hypothetical protein